MRKVYICKKKGINLLHFATLITNLKIAILTVFANIYISKAALVDKRVCPKTMTSFKYLDPCNERFSSDRSPELKINALRS